MFNFLPNKFKSNNTTKNKNSNRFVPFTLFFIKIIANNFGYDNLTISIEGVVILNNDKSCDKFLRNSISVVIIFKAIIHAFRVSME